MGKISNFIVVAAITGATLVGGFYPMKTFAQEKVGRLCQDSLESKVSNVSDLAEETSQVFSMKERREIQKILYAEAANQSSQNRRLVVKCILNRVSHKDYPNDIYSVIHQRNAFSCTFDGNKLWGQASGEIPMNGYERKVFDGCGEDTREVLDGFKIGIPRESEIVAYRDISIEKPNSTYWNSLEKIYESERLVFYVPKSVE
ncbi:cell wall hydrolase [Candidatus Pacearchaeota archaeon]|nr:cell wall hydrolase [Candidatus Pacearchaeota archaeon]